MKKQLLHCLLLLFLVSSLSTSRSQTVLIGLDEYAFQLEVAGSPSLLGMFFSAANTRYELTDDTGNPVFFVNPVGSISHFKTRVGIGTETTGFQLQVLGDARFGGADNYATIDDFGKLRFFGTGGMMISNDAYAFSANSSPLAGIFFNGTDGIIEFKDVMGNPVFAVTAVSAGAGNTDIQGDLEVQGSASFNGPATLNQLNSVTENGALLSAVRGQGFNDFTTGYLGVLGDLNHDGSGLDIGGNEIGVLGISTGTSSLLIDNYGVFGWSDHVGVRGENVSGDYAELGTESHALFVSGPSLLLGNVLMSDTLEVNTALNISSAADGSLTEDGPLRVGLTAGAHLSIDHHGIQAKGFDEAANLSLNPLGGNVNICESGGDVNIAEGGGEVAIANMLFTDAANLRMSAGAPAPLYTFHIKHPTGTASNGLAIENDLTQETWQLYTFSSGDLGLFQGGVQKGTFDNVSGTYTETSDARLKTNVSNLENPLSLLMQLRPRTYQFSNHPDDERPYYGFIAQEMQKVLPELVHEQDESEFYTVAYRELIPMLVGAVQQQQQTIEEQAGQLEATSDLEDRIQILEGALNNALIRLDALESNSDKNGNSSEEKFNQATRTGAFLGSNRPNPFRNSSMVSCFIPGSVVEAEMVVSDMQGVVRMRTKILRRGAFEFELKGGELAAGSYVYYLLTDGQKAGSSLMSIER